MENNLNFTPEQLEQVKAAPSAAALLAFAQENGFTLTAEQAALCFVQLHSKEGALSDEELDNVAGGGCSDGYTCSKCGSTNTEGHFFSYHCYGCGDHFSLF